MSDIFWIFDYCNNLYITDIEDFYPVYTEVEPFHDTTPRPVLIFGVAAEALIEQLLEEHPETFVSPKTGKYKASSINAHIRTKSILKELPILHGRIGYLHIIWWQF